MPAARATLSKVTDPSAMISEYPKPDEPTLSVVIPSYNSAEWLPSTLESLAAAVVAAACEVEVLVIDDGSTDATGDVVAGLAATFPGAVEHIRQDNRGRFLARWEGVSRSRAHVVLLLDSRVLISQDAIAYVLGAIAEDPSRVAWNAHIRTDPSAPLIGLFWDVPTYVFWGGYLRNPRAFDLTGATFDSAPKGTTMFLATAGVLREAFEFAWPEADPKLVSDDTKLLRHIAETSSIRLDPGFSATYRPRTTVRGFVRHTYDRGTLFVDSYAGTSLVRSAAILALALAPVALLALIVALAVGGAGLLALAVGAAAVLLALAPVLPAARNHCPRRSLVAYVCCLPMFVAPFWLGLARGVFIHRQAFVGNRVGVPMKSAGKETA